MSMAGARSTSKKPTKKVAKKTLPKLLRRRSSFSHGIELPGPSAKRKQQGLPLLKEEPSAASKRRKGVDGAVLPNEAASPYATFPRPSASEVVHLHTALARHFGERRSSGNRNKRDILDTVVGTILSQNTTNINSHRAFAQLKAHFPTWDAVRTAKPATVEASIKCGGLAPKKTQWIQHVLKTLHSEKGKTSMEYLRKESKEQVHWELERFPGIGKKTSAIINLFDVGHPDMAVDTHVFRYALQLGWVPTDKERQAHNKKAASKKDMWPVVTRDSVYAHLDSRFPDRLKYSMHLILTDTVGGLPVVCGASKTLSFDGRNIAIDGQTFKK
mmetsp:Transcript_80144/g.154933  ORF Transcript_80144/g.154933 Transcript_80144/m.154933 type:complete len:329 (-) Transcript_80144:359-1345(-)